MKKKSLMIILGSVVAVLLAGYVLSRYTSWPLDLGKTEGDIGKAEKFSAYVVMQSRASQFATLVELSNVAAEGIDPLVDVLKDMNKGRELISNVNEQIALAGADLEAALGGEQCPDLAQKTMNATLAYTTLQKQNTLANRFIEATDKYLAGNKGSDQLKLVRDQWVDYQKMTAALEDNAEAVKELEDKGYLLSEEKAKAALGSYEEAAQEVMSLNSILCVCMNLNNNLGIRVKNGEFLGIRVKNGENLGVRVKNGEDLGVRVKNGENLGVRVKNGENLGVRVKSAENLGLLNFPKVNAIFNGVVIRSEAAAELNKDIKLGSQINQIILQTAVGHKATLNLN